LVALVALVPFNVTFEPGTAVVFTNGVNVFVGATVAFPGSFFGWATHPVARIQPTVTRMVKSTIIFMVDSPLLLMDYLSCDTENSL
jgi:hypothetical protein